MSELKKFDSGQDWNFDDIEDAYLRLEQIVQDKYKFDYYPNQIEIIASEQMLDAYTSVGMPIYYNHWSFGRQFVAQQDQYRRGYTGLAYEIVINSNPCIAYLMEENTMCLQTLVMAHASFGHNGFFKNNFLYKQWTDAGAIIDYLVFAKNYIRECEEKYGVDEVEAVLDACHSLQYHGVDKYRRPSRLSASETERRKKEREEYLQSQLNDIWRTIPTFGDQSSGDLRKDVFPKEPQENILYFIEKNAPNLDRWKREIIRIVRKLAQYFYPQIQTRLMNEGFATYMHYNLMQDMYDRGHVTDGFMLEALDSHSKVVLQRNYTNKYYGGINVYSLGFEIYRDIERICTNPTDEDRRWFPDWAGNGKPFETIMFAVKNFKDDSFVLQYLSPKVMRDYHLFHVIDDDRNEMYYDVGGIHDDDGYREVREELARSYTISEKIPDIQITKVHRWTNRSMELVHTATNRRSLHERDARKTIENIKFLWGYDATVYSFNVEPDGKKVPLSLFSTATVI